MAERLTRIAIVSEDKCKPKKCRQECKKSCPIVKTGFLPPEALGSPPPPWVLATTSAAPPPPPPSITTATRTRTASAPPPAATATRTRTASAPPVIEKKGVKRRRSKHGVREADPERRHRPQARQGPEGHRPLHRLRKDGDLSKKFWSTKDPGQQPFSFNIGLGSVIKGWDEGVMTMQVGEVARIQCTPDYAYGAGGFPAWGIKPNSVLIFEIEVLSAQ